ncbi:MAG: hypothetical protein IKZ58_07040 [Selenomonadaceae bacterium]|nr:hypothetical protein [Selenomonadaceae bacterium]
MIDLTTPIIPYKGTGIFQLNANYDEVKNLLKVNSISYKEEIWNKTDPDHLWNVIVITKEGSPEQYSAIELFFAQKRLFKICLCEDFEGTLPNGIHTGMSIKEAWKIDKKLQQDEDWDEVYISPNGYFIEYSNKNLSIIIITIFITALERDDFFEYNW